MDDTRPVERRAATPSVKPVSAAPLLAVFTGTLFLSALLLFAVQPIFARMVLPVLGGSPAVWSVAMCFFQAALLGGYAYAHWLNGHVRTPLAVIAHLGLLMLAMLLLPVALAEGWTRPPQEGLHLWVLALFGVSIGLPFFALAGNAPLLQAWFARTGHKHAGDPYFLYGASNLGSLLALLSYPVLIEPVMSLAEQSEIWTFGYKLLAVFVGLCGLAMLVSRVPKQEQTARNSAAASPRTDTAITWQRKFSWLGLAFVPSGLLVAVTSHVTTDVAAAPFLWVLPLALFLLTFVITFQRRPLLPHNLMLAAQPVAIALLLLSMQFPFGKYWGWFLAVHLAAFFINTMVCHGELVRRRPVARDLTRFYLWMSLGGALGGLFAGLIAPQIFSTVIEYPVMILLALLARPGFQALKARTALRDTILATGLLLVAAGPKLFAGIEVIEHLPRLYIAVFTLFAAAIILSRTAAFRLAALVAVTIVTSHILKPETAKGDSYRSFFGVNRVVETPDGQYRLLTHGTTIHGAQKLRPDSSGPPEPLTYYHRAGPFADIFNAARQDRTPDNIAVVGLGAGSLACYARPGENWRFYEIDPIVVRLASDPVQFNFLSECAPGAPVIVGDARLTLGDEPPARFDIIVVDAFSSDAIPVHLLTREALKVYLSKLTANGIVALHISNRNMDLRPVLAAAARDMGLAALVRHGGKVGDLRSTYKTAATLVAIAKSEKDLDVLRGIKGWGQLEDAGWRVWSDDYSNILRAIFAKSAAQGSKQ